MAGYITRGAARQRSGGRAAHPSPLELRRKLLAAASGGAVSPVYLLYGEESYLVEDTARRLIAKVMPDEQREFGLEVLSGSSVSTAEVREALSTLPLFGGRRVVWLRSCGLFSSSERAEAVRTHLPREGQGVAVVVTESEADRRFALYRDMETRGVVCEFAHLAETNDSHLRSLYDLVTEKLAEDGHEISRETLLYLVQLVGTDLRSLVAEIEKLSLHAGSRRKIERDDIDLLVTCARETVAYQLAEAVAAGDANRSLAMLRRILGQNEEPLRVLGALLTRVRYLIQAKELIESGVLAPSTVRAGYPAFRQALGRLPQAIREAFPHPRKRYNLLRAHPFVAFKTFEEAARIPIGKLRAGFDRVLRVDGELKGGRRSKAEALEDLVVALCRLMRPHHSAPQKERNRIHADER
jgi:DNA polymerase-3 subunit delta